jgi:hypothetical protein
MHLSRLEPLKNEISLLAPDVARKVEVEVDHHSTLLWRACLVKINRSLTVQRQCVQRPWAG